MSLDNEAVRLALDMVNIKSDGAKDGEREVAEYISGYLDGIGIKSEIIEYSRRRCNVIAQIGEGEGLMLNGHMDTVPLGDIGLWTNGTGGKIIGGKIFGRGSSDMKGGIAAILAGLHAAQVKRPKRRLVLAFVADEENGLTGSTWLLKNRKAFFRNVKYGIIAEPTDMAIHIAQKGIAHIRLVVKGKSAHGSVPWLGRNAIVDMSKAIDAISKLEGSFKIKDKLLGKGTINVGRISGGNAINIVPERCEIEIDRRLVPGESPELALSQIRGAIRKLGIDYEIEVTLARSPFSLPESSRIVKLVSCVTGGKVSGTYGYTEIELYKALGNIDSLIFGPGATRTIHRPDEYISIADLKRCSGYFSAIISSWCTGR